MTDRRARVNELLGTYHPANQSTNVPTPSSYSSVGSTRASSRTGTDYLDTYSARRLSNVSDEHSPSRAYLRTNSEYTPDRASTSAARSRSPSRYDTSGSYTGRRNRYDDDTTSSGTSYSSRYTPTASTSYTPTASTSYTPTATTSRTSGSDEINRLSRNLERSVSSILSGNYRRERDNREFMESYQSERRARDTSNSTAGSTNVEPLSAEPASGTIS